MPDIINPNSLTNELKIASGTQTGVAATDVVATGLRKVLRVVVSFESDASDAGYMVTAAPHATILGSFNLKTWKTDGTDPTPVAATAFGKLISWIAIGY